MIKKYHLDFISKKPGSLKSAWQELIQAGLLASNRGILTGLFRAGSAELSRILELYERDKEALQVRMESSCSVEYDQNDLDSYPLLKFYPQQVELIRNKERTPIYCGECGRKVGLTRSGSLAIPSDAAIPCGPVATTPEGDLLLRDDLVDQIKAYDGNEGLLLVAVYGPSNKGIWFEVESAPTALRFGTREGFCSECGNAIKTDVLPEVDETYRDEIKRNFVLSPDRPKLPCFTKNLANWLLASSSSISWADFKPISLRIA